MNLHDFIAIVLAVLIGFGLGLLVAADGLEGIRRK